MFGYINKTKEVKLSCNLYVLSLGKMLFTYKKVSDLRQIEPSHGLNSRQARLCVVKTMSTKKKHHTFSCLISLYCFSRGHVTESAYWKNINILVNSYELLLDTENCAGWSWW